MPDDTLAMLRRLNAAGGMPNGWRLIDCGDEYGNLMGPRHGQWFHWGEPRQGWDTGAEYRFTVDLATHLAAKGVTCLMTKPSTATTPQWCCGRTRSRWCGAALDNLMEIEQATFYRGGPGVDGLLRAALAVLEHNTD